MLVFFFKYLCRVASESPVLGLVQTVKFVNGKLCLLMIQDLKYTRSLFLFVRFLMVCLL